MGEIYGVINIPFLIYYFMFLFRIGGQVDTCNTPGVTMAMAYLCTNDCDHMWEKLEEKSMKPWEPCINQEC
jgi:hypothetical protein